jgi:hypothetical protein
VPAQPLNRLVPASSIKAVHNQAFSQVDEALVTPAAGSNKSTKAPCLRGPIEMDPNEAVDLLNENPDDK